MNRKRELKTGRYTYENFNLMCVCGHPLSVHSATRIKIAGASYQECMIESLGNDCPVDYKGQKCNCKCFKPQKEG